MRRSKKSLASGALPRTHNPKRGYTPPWTLPLTRADYHDLGAQLCLVLKSGLATPLTLVIVYDPAIIVLDCLVPQFDCSSNVFYLGVIFSRVVSA